MKPSLPLRAALLGNPNTGKTTIFNALTGFRARVGNYPGVTVESRTGPLSDSNGSVEIIDLPGTYSLAARSVDEMVAVDVLLGRMQGEPRPDVVLLVVDASNVERNLYLATQVMETGLPTVVLLNMMDQAAAAGIQIDANLLSERLGVPVVPMVASKGQGLAETIHFLKPGAVGVRSNTPPPVPHPILPPEVQAVASNLREDLTSAGVPESEAEPFLVCRTLLEIGGVAEQRFIAIGGEKAGRLIETARGRLADLGFRVQTLESRARYGWIRKALDGVVDRPTSPVKTFSDKLDAVLIHKVWGTLVFVFAMLIVFQAIFSWSAPAMDAIDGAFGWMGDAVSTRMEDGPLKSLVVDGVIAGVGGVVIFLPQIMVLFFFIGVLEDCGYMARAAFLMDRLLSKCGLSGRSFIPMLSSFACAIPGIMATRTIEDRRDRITTILVAPLMSCSARLPVYTLFIAAFIPAHVIIPGVMGTQSLTMLAMYLVGVVVAIPVALILKRTLLKGRTPAFIMELPPYKMPLWKTVFHRMGERGVAFLKRAGTIIFAVSVVVWAATYYPRGNDIDARVEATFEPRIAAADQELTAWIGQPGGAESEDELAAEATRIAEMPEDAVVKANDELAPGLELLSARDALAAERDHAIDGEHLRNSILGRMGRVIEPLVKPLGWDWKIGMAAIASFPAREVIVSTLGIIYDVGGDADEESVDLREKLQSATNEAGRPIFNVAVALSIMVFFALCAQCAATLAIIKRETNSWAWPLFAFAYMTGLAYVAAAITYQVAVRFLS